MQATPCQDGTSKQESAIPSKLLHTADVEIWSGLLSLAISLCLHFSLFFLSIELPEKPITPAPVALQVVQVYTLPKQVQEQFLQEEVHSVQKEVQPVKAKSRKIEQIDPQEPPELPLEALYLPPRPGLYPTAAEEIDDSPPRDLLEDADVSTTSSSDLPDMRDNLNPETVPKLSGLAPSVMSDVEPKAKQKMEPACEPKTLHLPEVEEAPPVQQETYSPPTVLQRIEPEYPFRARKRGWSGEVALIITISPGGQVEGVQVTKSSGYAILDDSAVLSVKGWGFSPAREGEEPVSGKIPILVRFVLE